MPKLDVTAVTGMLRWIGGLLRGTVALVVTCMQRAVMRWRGAEALAAESLFLRKQLALYQERQLKARPAYDALRIALVWFSRRFNWRDALVIVKPATLVRWHRQGVHGELLIKLQREGGTSHGRATSRRSTSYPWYDPGRSTMRVRGYPGLDDNARRAHGERHLY
jgi:hypothetical protein